MTRPFMVVLVALLASACGGRPTGKAAAPAPAPASSPASSVAVRGPQSLANTAELVSRPEVRQLVDELAAAPRVASERVSFDGHRSAEYTIYERLRTAATDAEMIALLAHVSPVVRSYAAQHVIERNLEGVSLEPLLADATLVNTQYGCLGGLSPVSRTTVQALCDFREKPLAARKLAELARQARGDLSTMATRCLAMK